MNKTVALCAVAASVAATPLLAERQSMGIYEGWGAFRDTETPRCYAIARPESGTSGAWEPFVSIGYWPRRNVRGQVHVRLRRDMRRGGSAIATIDGRRFQLVGRGPDAWAADREADAVIVSALRRGMEMRIEATASTGPFRDTYSLRGAASAIDAAALGCA